MSDTLSYDVIIVGGGPAGLSAAIRLKQLASDLSVCVLEKATAFGAHTLSGAVLETRALNELIPDWRHQDAPINRPVTHDQFLYLTKKSSWRLPTPPQMHNRGNYIVSLGDVTQWLSKKAEELGVDLYPGFPVTHGLFGDNGALCGVQTGAFGLERDGTPSSAYQPGVPIAAQHVLLAEGCRGSLSEELMTRFQLRDTCAPQTYGLGFKEVWEIDPSLSKPGAVIHTVGWPLQSDTYGGSFIYHLDDNKLAVGLVVGLDYTNPYFDPFEEFQRFKKHPMMAALLKGGKRLSYGARALNEGGFQSIPAVAFPGGSLIGCGAGFMNVPKIKGTHTAMKSGMLAAEGIVDQLVHGKGNTYADRLASSWIYDELKAVRNIRPGFRLGLLGGLANAALETYITRGKSPWTLTHHVDHLSLRHKNECTPIDYPKCDGTLTFDRLSSVYLANTVSREGQPSHLHIKNWDKMITLNYEHFDSPEQRYCPAGVYEIVRTAEGSPALHVNSANCIHCKACDIKDPAQNIHWTPPEGGSGPLYTSM